LAAISETGRLAQRDGDFRDCRLDTAWTDGGTRTGGRIDLAIQHEGTNDG
jgi:hypothetical protein